MNSKSAACLSVALDTGMHSVIPWRSFRFSDAKTLELLLDTGEYRRALGTPEGQADLIC